VTVARAGQGRAEQAGAEVPAVGDNDDADVLALPHPDWLYHHLGITGEADLVTLFRQAATGPGAIPWRDGLAQAEEDWFHLLAASRGSNPRSISLHGARILAGQLRDAAERRREQVSARAGRGGGACPLDLHRLLPVPDDLLRLGPGHPEARRWLWEHWGTTWPLRHVAELPVAKAGQRPARTPGGCGSASGRPIGRPGRPSSGCARTGRRCASRCGPFYDAG
jgi:hypothetical protein